MGIDEIVRYVIDRAKQQADRKIAVFVVGGKVKTIKASGSLRFELLINECVNGRAGGFVGVYAADVMPSYIAEDLRFCGVK